MAADTPGAERAASGLKYYQYLVRSVMTNPEYGIREAGNGRGSPLHDAAGKTMLAVAVAMAMGRPTPFVIVPKSLQKNFVQTIHKFVAMQASGRSPPALKKAQAEAERRFKFVSLDAYNMAAQVARATSGVGGAGSINNRLLIIDEAHNLFRGIINSASEKTNARQLYNMIMEARNLRILFLTGTPASKDPFELVPCFNMLVGDELLPTTYEVFYWNFVDVAAGRSVTKQARQPPAGPRFPCVPPASHGAVTGHGRVPVGRGPESGPCFARSGGVPRGVPDEDRASGDVERTVPAVPACSRQRGGRGEERRRRRPRGNASTSQPLSLPGSAANVGSTYYVKSRGLSNFAPPRDERMTPSTRCRSPPSRKNLSQRAAAGEHREIAGAGAGLLAVCRAGLGVVARYLERRVRAIRSPRYARQGGMEAFMVETSDAGAKAAWLRVETAEAVSRSPEARWSPRGPFSGARFYDTHKVWNLMKADPAPVEKVPMASSAHARQPLVGRGPRGTQREHRAG